MEHSTDAFVQAYGSDLDGLFENCAKGMVNIMFDIEKVEICESMTITANGEELENLLYDWLEKVLLKILVDQIVLSRFSIEISERCLNAYKKGYFLKAQAVTYHELKIQRIDTKFVATFLVDL